MENIHSTHKDQPFGWFEALRKLVKRGEGARQQAWTKCAEKAVETKRVIGRVDRPVPRHLAHFG